jgi:hypothetical protein
MDKEVEYKTIDFWLSNIILQEYTIFFPWSL